MREPDRSGRLYKRLLSLYPKEFRDRMGPSMEQTFADSVRERRERRGDSFAFLTWTFAETSMGVIMERTRTATTWIVAAIVGLVLVLPFATMEWVTATDHPRASFHFAWFVLLWLLAAVFIHTLVGVVRTAMAVRAEHVVVVRTVSLVPRVAALGLIAWFWIGLVVDQMPCFLGVTGC